MTNLFQELERDNILLVKNKLKKALTQFNMTIGKLHNNFTRSYFVSGGCIGSLIRGEEPNDYDIYFFSKLKAAAVVNLYTNDPSYKNDVAEWNEKYHDAPMGQKMITVNAVTLKNKIQLITKIYGEPIDIRKSFDFVHCMPYYDTRDDSLYISHEQFWLCENKLLKVNNEGSITDRRIEKFTSKGWKHYGSNTTIN